MIDSSSTNSIQYQIERGTDFRIGTIQVAQFNGTAGTVALDDDYTEANDVGVVWGFTANANAVMLQYTTSSTGDNAEFKYYLRSFV